MTTFRMFEYLKNRSYRPSTKQSLNNFWGDFLEKLKQFLGRGSKMDCLYKKRCTIFWQLGYRMYCNTEYIAVGFDALRSTIGKSVM